MARYSLEGYRRAENVRQFCRRHIVIPDGPGAGKPLEFEPWYWKNFILPVYGTLNDQGNRKYSKALLGVSRWHIKSTSAAALGLYSMACEPMHGAENNAVATTRKQAGKTFNKARRMVMADPLLHSMFELTKTTIECKETGETFDVLPHDADTAQGFHPKLAVLDEIHVYRNLEMVEAMVSGGAGYAEPLTLAITTAGAARRGAWWQMIKRWLEDPTAYVYWHGAATIEEILAGTDEFDPTDPAVWRRANPASWLTDEILQRQFYSLPLASFIRYHLNVPPRVGANKIFPPGRWRACSDLPRLEPTAISIAATDASLRRDHTAVVFDQFDADRMHNVLCFTFTPEEDGGIMEAIDHDEVGMLLRELAAEYIVARMPCDRAYFVRTMRELLAEGLPIEEFRQTNENMAKACQALYDVVTEKRIRHGGDVELETHVLNAAVKETPFGWRITKPAPEEKIDAAIALAMAVYIAEAEAEQGGGVGVSVG